MLLFLNKDKKDTRDTEFRGAGGSEGGVFNFFLGLVMMIGGVYLFLTNLYVGGYGMGSRIGMGGMDFPSGFVLIPMIFGIGIIFYNSRNYMGWILAVGSFIMLIFGAITSVQFHFRNLDAFELIVILVLMIGGIGLFLNSLKKLS